MRLKPPSVSKPELAREAAAKIDAEFDAVFLKHFAKRVQKLSSALGVFYYREAKVCVVFVEAAPKVSIILYKFRTTPEEMASEKALNQHVDRVASIFRMFKLGLLPLKPVIDNMRHTQPSFSRGKQL